MPRRAITMVTVVFMVLLILAVPACGRGEDRPRSVTADDDPTPAAAGNLDDDYEPTTDVAVDAAVGRTIRAIRAHMATPQRAPIDWPAVEVLWRSGDSATGAPPLDRLVDLPAPRQLVDDGITGTGPLAGASDAVRRQTVDQGLLVMLSARMAEELDAVESADAGDRVHDVDQAWAFFTADGAGLAALATQLERYFSIEGRLRQPVIDALVSAQSGAAGREHSLSAALADARRGVSYLLAVATIRYAADQGELARRAAAQALYTGIEGEVEATAPGAHQAVIAGLHVGDGGRVRTALDSQEVRGALGWPALPDSPAAASQARMPGLPPAHGVRYTYSGQIAAIRGAGTRRERLTRSVE